jgi:hypothetical protein
MDTCASPVLNRVASIKRTGLEVITLLSEVVIRKFTLKKCVLITSAFFLDKKVPELNKFRTMIGEYFMLIFLFHISINTKSIEIKLKYLNNLNNLSLII